jgi:hypothetical protein
MLCRFKLWFPDTAGNFPVMQGKFPVHPVRELVAKAMDIT